MAAISSPSVLRGARKRFAYGTAPRALDWLSAVGTLSLADVPVGVGLAARRCRPRRTRSGRRARRLGRGSRRSSSCGMWVTWVLTVVSRRATRRGRRLLDATELDQLDVELAGRAT